jgi:6-phosphogluconolactonase
MAGTRTSRCLATVAAALACAAASGTAHAASVYVSNQGSFPGQLWPLAVGADGSISARTPPSYSTANDPARVAVTPDGKYVYSSSYSTSLTLNQFGVTAGGGLAPLTPATVATSKYSWPIVVSPDGTSAYLADFPGPGYAVEQLTVTASGALVHKSPGSVPVTGADDIVMTPDGRHLYVSNFGGSGVIDQFNVAADGTLTHNSPATVSTSPFPVGMAVTPDGKSLYVGLQVGTPTSIAQFDINANGTLTAKSPASVNMPASALPVAMATSPDGQNLYVASDATGGGVDQFSIGAGGKLTAMTPASVGTQTVNNVAVSPDGKTLYANYTSSGGGTARFTIGAGGNLATTTNSVATGSAPSGLAVTPDQGPTAAFTATPATAGSATVFNAVASSDSDDAIVRYDWTFGDGGAATTPGPAVSHVYAAAGTYAATLTVTDNTGTSTTRVFTGHQVVRNGGPAAQVAHSVVVPALPPPASVLAHIGRLRISPKRFRVGPPAAGISRKRAPKGSKVSFDLDAAGHVLVRVQLRKSGRLKGKRCFTSRKRGKRCTLYVTLKGTVHLTGVEGANSVAFSGRIAGHKLKPGGYRLVVTPYLGTAKAPAARASFTIVR